MSLSIPPLPVVKVLDSRCDINNQRVYAVVKGGTSYTYMQFNAPNMATNSFNIQANPPNAQTIVNRKVYLEESIQFVFASLGAAPVGPLLQLGTNDGLRAFPISSLINSLQVQINNQQQSVNLNNFLAPFLHYSNPVKQQDYDLSLTPSMLDQYQSLDDWRNYGAERNPLSQYGVNSTQQTRGGFPYTNVINVAGAGVATVQVKVTEPIMMSPFTYGCGDKSGFIGVQTLQFNFQTGYGSTPGLSYAWSHNAVSGNALSAVSPLTTFYSTPRLLMQFISPDPLEAIPPQISYAFNNIVTYNSAVGGVLAAQVLGATTTQTLNLNNIQLENIPNRIALWVRKDVNSGGTAGPATFADSDTFASITNVSIIFNNKASLLQTCTPQDLYQMSVKNGYCGSWAQWSQYQGSVLFIDPATDLGLESDVADGSLGSRNLQIQITFFNPTAPTQPNLVVDNSRTVQYVIWCAVVSEGVFTIRNQQAIISTAVLTPEDVLASHTSEKYDYSSIQKEQQCIGGSLFSDIASMGRSIGEKTLLPAFKALSGMGASSGGASSGGRHHSHRRGGAMISHSELASRQH